MGKRAPRIILDRECGDSFGGRRIHTIENMSGHQVVFRVMPNQKETVETLDFAQAAGKIMHQRA